MNHKYTKQLLFSLIIGSCLLFFDYTILKNGLSTTISPEYFFGILVLAQIIYLPLFEKFKFIFEKFFYKTGNYYNSVINDLSFKLNTISKFESLLFSIDDIFNEYLGDAQPLIFLLGKEARFLNTSIKSVKINHTINNSSRIMKEDHFADISSYSVELKDFSDLFEAHNLTQFYLLKTENKLIGIAFIPKQFAKHLHIDRFNTTFSRFLQKVADLSVKTKLFDQLNLQLLENKLITEVTTKLTKSLDLQDVLKTIIDGLKQIIDYDAIGIFLNEDDRLRQLISKGYDKEIISKMDSEKKEGIINWSFQNEEPVVVPDVSKNEYYYEVRKETKSQITIPLINKTTCLGTFALESNTLNHFTDESVKLLLPFAKQASIAIMNARLFNIAQQKAVLEEEMLDASNIQKAILPKRVPMFESLDAAIYTKPCKFVGGDMHDAVKLDDQQLLLAIGDVSGKGTPAGILMAVLFAGLRSEIRRQAKPNMGELNARLNHLLYNVTSSSFYATFFLGMYDKNKRKFYFSNAGHNHPILIRENGEIQELSKGGMVLGFLDNETYFQDSVELEIGDIVIMYTDGLNEAFDRNNDEFGEENIVKTITEHRTKSAVQIKAELMKALIAHHGGDENLEDDITIILFKVVEE